MKCIRIVMGLLKLVLWISLPVSLGVGGLFVYSQMKDWNQEAQLVATQVQAATGRQLFIKGGVKFQFFPRPVLILNDARLDNIPGAAADALVRVPAMIITPSLLSLLTGDVQAEDITLVSPVVALEILPDGRKSWDLTLRSGTQVGGDAAAQAMLLPQITLKDAVFKGYNQQTKFETRLAKISGVAVPQGAQGALKFSGTITRTHNPVAVVLETGAWTAQGEVPLSLELKSGISSLKLKGALQHIGTAAQYNFALEGQADQALLPFGARLAKQPNAAPVKFSAQISGTAKTLKVADLQLDGASVAGLGEGVVDLTQPRPAVKVNLLLSRAVLAAKMLLPSGAATLAPTATPAQAAADPSFRVGDIGFGKYYEVNLLHDVDMVVDLGIKEAQFQKEALSDVRVNVNSMAGGGLELRNLSARLPGETTLEAKGVISDDGSVSDMAARFVGNVRVYGKSLKQFLSWLQVDLPPIPKEKLNAFALSANMVLSKREVSVPALVARFDDTSVTGGSASVSNDPQKPSQIALVMENLNLDLYLPKLGDLIREAGGSAQEAQYEKLNAVQRKFDFLRAMETTFGATDMVFTINNLIYKGEPVTKASSRIRFGSARLELSDIDVISKNVQMRGKISVDASGLRPNIDADLEVEDFNTDDVPGLRVFFVEKQAPQEPAAEGSAPLSERWSKELLDLRDLQAYDGKARVYFRSLTHQKVLFENVSMQLHFKENFLYADSIRATMFDGGKFDGKAVLNIASQPALSLSFALSNASLKEALSQLLGVKAVTEGRFSTSGSISTMGHDIRGMVSRMEGSLNLILRGAKIKGFDFVALTQSLAKILSAKQMRDIADAALRPDGSGPGSMFYDYAAGSLILAGGTIGMNDLQLLSPNFPPLVVSGNVNLGSWTYDMLLKTGLPLGPSGGFSLRRTVNANDVPVSLRIQNSIDNPTLTWEKNAISRYWEKRFYKE